MLDTLAAARSHTEPNGTLSAQHDDWIIEQAITILEARVFRAGPLLNNTTALRDYLRLKLMAEPNEVFVAIFLNSQHLVLACETLFTGTVNFIAVHPRVVVQRALALNASGLIMAHQHPSGGTSPSSGDVTHTKRLKAALETVDVRVLDHLIVGKGEPFSFASSGLL